MHLTKKVAMFILFIILSVLAFTIIAYGMFFVQIKTVPYTFYGAGGVYDEHGNALVFQRQIDFTASGSFSAENKIHVKVILYNCNSSRLLDYMSEVGFSDAFYYYPPISSKINAALSLTRELGGNYTAEGDLLWHTSGNTYMYPIAPAPKGTLNYNDANEIENGTRSVLFISPTSDYISIQASHTMEQLTWVIIGLTVIMLFPVITALMPEEKIINIRINGIDLTKLVDEEKAKQEKEKENKKKQRFWTKK